MSRRNPLAVVALLALTAAALPAAPAAAQDKRVKRAAVLRDLRAVPAAVRRAPVRRVQRRRALRDARAARRLFARRKACAANARLGRAHRRLAGRRAARARLRVTRARTKLLRSLPRGKACGGIPSFDVDTSVRPQARSLPALVGSGRRPVARVVDAGGGGADFVADELWVASADEAAVQRLVRRWRGRILKTVPVPDGATQYLIRIDTSRADLAGLAADVARLGRTRGTANRVSSEQGLELLAIAADEAAAIKGVGVNWVGRGAAISQGFTREGGDGPDGFSQTVTGWNPDAFTWKHLGAGTAQDMGVTEGWRLLEGVGRLNRNSVPLAVLDMGFAPATNGPDFGTDYTAISNVPFTGAIGTANLLGCGSGSCPWHGTNVLNAAAAPADDEAGAAGVAGPVARPVVVFTLYDMFTGIAAVSEAFIAGARVANMSYSAGVPAALSWAALPFEGATAGFRAAGMIQFASAGNSDIDIDATDCFIVCWEETFHTPCENGGVICVGALAHDSLGKASYSNRGNGQVDIWAPGTVLVGPTPQRSNVHAVNGTSFASPYMAGVAALLKAARPAIGAGDIETIINRTARRGTSPVRRIVSPLAAVRDALPPLVHIRSPADGASIPRGSGIGFDAFGYDDGLGVSSVSWTLGGTPVGDGTNFTRNDLPYGTHDVVVTMRTGDGGTFRDSVRITITNDPPTIDLTSPADGADVFQAQNVTFRSTSFDPNEPESGYRLPEAGVTWHLDGSLTPWATGHTATRDFSGVSPGRHLITVRGDDGRAIAEETIAIDVLENPPDLPPSAQITAPDDGDTFLVDSPTPDGTGYYYKDVPFTSSASDPEAQPLSYEWSDAVDGGPPTVVSTDPNPTIRLHERDVGCDATSHQITLKVTDGGGSTATDSITVSAYNLC